MPILTLLHYPNLYAILDMILVYIIGLMPCATWLNASLRACDFFDMFILSFIDESMFLFFL